MTDPDSPSENQSWAAEAGFRSRELAVKEREQVTRELELELRRGELARAGWRSPLVLAIFAAAVGALGNAGVAYLNGTWGRRLESERAEAARILEVIKTGDVEKAVSNLEFLLDAGLISSDTRLREYLKNRRAGTGPALPAPPGTTMTPTLTLSRESAEVGHQ